MPPEGEDELRPTRQNPGEDKLRTYGAESERTQGSPLPGCGDFRWFHGRGPPADRPLLRAGEDDLECLVGRFVLHADGLAEGSAFHRLRGGLEADAALIHGDRHVLTRA